MSPETKGEATQSQEELTEDQLKDKISQLEAQRTELQSSSQIGGAGGETLGMHDSTYQYYRSLGAQAEQYRQRLAKLQSEKKEEK